MELSSVSKVEPWKRLWQIFAREEWKSGKDKEFEWVLYAFQKLICPSKTVETIRRDIVEEVKNIEEEISEEKKQKRKEAWKYHWMTCLLNDDKDKINLEIEKKEQQEELKELRKEMELIKKSRWELSILNNN